MSVSGGCQCGAVRYRVDGELGRPSICHCRMCQKAFGAFYGPFVTARSEDVAWTRGAPKRFQSSNKVWRGFCGDCGTPLTFEQVEGQIDISIGSLDDPTPHKPQVQLGSPHRLPWVDELGDLPMLDETNTAKIAAYQAELVSYQHPDHDTPEWPATT